MLSALHMMRNWPSGNGVGFLAPIRPISVQKQFTRRSPQIPRGSYYSLCFFAVEEDAPFDLESTVESMRFALRSAFVARCGVWTVPVCRLSVGNGTGKAACRKLSLFISFELGDN